MALSFIGVALTPADKIYHRDPLKIGLEAASRMSWALYIVNLSKV